MTPVFLTTPELRAKYWPLAAPLLQPVIEHACHGEFSMEDLNNLVSQGLAIAGVLINDGVKLCMVFEYRHYPRKTLINIMALGGENLQETAMIFLPHFREWATESGIKEIEASVSPAMARLLKPLGFTSTYQTVRLPC